MSQELVAELTNTGVLTLLTA